jgi:hypothetical protein
LSSGLPASPLMANCARSRCEKVFEDVLAIHRGERLFANFAVHFPFGGPGFRLCTHYLVVRATFRAFEISGNVSVEHLHNGGKASERAFQAVRTSLGTWATQASFGFHRWICPHAAHRRGRATSGKVSKITISTVKPVRTGLRFCGHLTRMWFTAGPPAAFKRTTNLISHLIDVASQVTALCLMQRHDLDEAPATTSG